MFDDHAGHGYYGPQFAMEFCAAESCGKCTPCRIGAVRGAELIERIRGGGSRSPDRVEALPQMHNAPKQARRRDENVALLEDLCETTARFASLCALGGFTPFPVLSERAQTLAGGFFVILGCVLAGGLSTRFGSDKALA